jgi:oligopeptidase B
VIVRVDNYFWLNNPEDKKVIDYLNAENAYYEKMTAHTKAFRDELFE